jgi:hypothetical protein
MNFLNETPVIMTSRIGPPEAPPAPVSLPRRVAAVLLAASAAVAPLAAEAAETTKFDASYSIIIRGVTIGHAKSEIRFNEDSYAAAITGQVSSFLRLFTDASADLAGSGKIAGDRILPMTYDFVTAEGDGQMRVSMTMQKGAVTGVDAAPVNKPRRDRVPVTQQHMRDVVDPLTAFLVAVAPGTPIDGQVACNRTVRVFDGWQRFDLQLSYKSTQRIEGKGDAYKGDAFVCSARYVPVAGHREGAKSVKDLVANKRLEVWLAPIAGRPMLAPYKIFMGDTRLGDLTVLATRFVAGQGKRAAN